MVSDHRRIRNGPIMQASVSFWRAVNQQLVALQEDDANRAAPPPAACISYYAGNSPPVTLLRERRFLFAEPLLETVCGGSFKIIYLATLPGGYLGK